MYEIVMINADLYLAQRKLKLIVYYDGLPKLDLT